MNVFASSPFKFNAGDPIYVTVQIWNQQGCSSYSSINQNKVVYGTTPTRGPYDMFIGNATNRNLIQLSWTTIPYHISDSGGY